MSLWIDPTDADYGPTRLKRWSDVRWMGSEGDLNRTVDNDLTLALAKSFREGTDHVRENRSRRQLKAWGLFLF